jgi:hypothetical protein
VCSSHGVRCDTGPVQITAHRTWAPSRARVRCLCDCATPATRSSQCCPPLLDSPTCVRLFICFISSRISVLVYSDLTPLHSLCKGMLTQRVKHLLTLSLMTSPVTPGSSIDAFMHSVSSCTFWKFFFSADMSTAFRDSRPLATTCRAINEKESVSEVYD